MLSNAWTKAADALARFNGPEQIPASIDITWSQLRSAFLSSWTLDERFDTAEFSKRLKKLGVNILGGVKP